MSRKITATLGGAFRASPQRLVDVLPEQRTVGEVGQRIVIRLMRQLLLQLCEPRDRPLHPAVLEDGRRPGGEGSEETQVARVEGASVEMAAHHQAADHPRFTPQQRHHRLTDASIGQHLGAGIVG